MSKDTIGIQLPPLCRQESGVDDVIFGTPTFMKRSLKPRPILRLKKKRIAGEVLQSDESIQPSRKMAVFMSNYDPANYPLETAEDITAPCSPDLPLPPSYEDYDMPFSNAESDVLKLGDRNMNDYEFRGYNGLLDASKWAPCELKSLQSGQFFRYTKPNFHRKYERTVNSAIITSVTPNGIKCQAKGDINKVWEVKLANEYAKYIRIYSYKTVE